MYAFLFDRKSLGLLVVAFVLVGSLLFGAGVLVGVQWRLEETAATWTARLTSASDRVDELSTLAQAAGLEVPPGVASAVEGLGRLDGSAAGRPAEASPAGIETYSPPPSELAGSSPPPSELAGSSPPSTVTARPGAASPETAPSEASPPPSAPRREPSTTLSPPPPSPSPPPPPPPPLPPPPLPPPSPPPPPSTPPAAAAVPETLAGPPTESIEPPAGDAGGSRPPASSAAGERGHWVYTVQVGAFKSEDNAQDRFDELVGKGFEPYIYLFRNQRGTLFHTVRVGRLASRGDAVELGELLVERIDFKPWEIRPGEPKILILKIADD